MLPEQHFFTWLYNEKVYWQNFDDLEITNLNCSIFLTVIT